MNTAQRSTIDRLRDMQYIPSEIIMCGDEIQHLEAQIKSLKELNVQVPQSEFDEFISLMNERKAKCEAELQWCIDIIASTEAQDPMLYQILCLHFIEGLNWVNTALQMPMKCTGDACRQRVYRWLDTLDV